jgi:hypothetical protein
MRNFKVNIDITDLFLDLKQFHLKEYPMPYLTLFIEADDPDDACYTLIQRLIKDILRRDTSISTRIFCRSIKKLIRFDKILSL